MPGEICLELVDPFADPEWDRLLASHSETTVFHTLAWARVLTSSYGYQPFYFRAIDKGKLAALLPFMEVRSWITGTRGASLPFTDQCPPILPVETSFNEAMDHVIALARSRGWKTVEIRGHGPGMGNLPASAEYLSHDLDLTEGETSLLSRYRPNVQRNIRKAEREGITVAEDHTPEGLREFYQLNCLTRREHGLPPQPTRFFEYLHEHILEKGLGFLMMARHKKKPVAGALFLLFDGKAIFKYGASDRRYQEIRANNLIFRDAIRLLCRRGARTLSFGRTGLHHDGLRKFKLSLGTTETRLQYVKYDVRSKTYLTANKALRENRWKKMLANLPLSALRIIGNVAYRHVG